MYVCPYVFSTDFNKIVFAEEIFALGEVKDGKNYCSGLGARIEKVVTLHISALSAKNKNSTDLLINVFIKNFIPNNVVKHQVFRITF